MNEKFYPYWGAKHPSAYELLNLSTDPEQHIETSMWALADPHESIMLDVGAGSGFHAVRYAQRAAHVFALEPDPLQRRQMHARLSNTEGLPISVLAAGAESIPLPEASIDLAIARFAYFFGALGCLPGMAQVKRVLRPGGSFFIVDTDPDHGRFGAIARRAYPQVYVREYTAQADALRRSGLYRPPRRHMLADPRPHIA